MEVIYNNDSWPLVILKMVGRPTTEEDIYRVIKLWAGIYTESMIKNEKYRLVFDVRESGIDKIQLLTHFATFLVKSKCMTEQWMERTSILVSDPSVSLLIKFVLNFYTPVRPFKVFTDDKECIEWTTSELPGEEPIKKLKKSSIKSSITF
jgi:hypothetical protein